MAKRVLLTGASGFVGANLTRFLIERGHDVTALLRPGHKPWRLEGIDALKVQTTDLTVRDAVARAVGSVRPDWIFHLAVYGAYPSQRTWTEMLQTNVIGTVNLVEACIEAGFESFVNTGSSSEYGFKDEAPAEVAALEPNSDYAVTKAAATLYCGFVARSRHVPIRTARLYSVYGPWEEPTRLVPTLIVNGLQGRLPPLADPQIARDFVFVDDVCDAYLAIASSTTAAPDAIFNIGTGVQTTLEEIVGHVRRLLSVDAQPEWGTMPNRRWDTSCWVANIQKIRSELSWTPRHSLESGLSETIDWFRARPTVRDFYANAG